MTRRSLVLVLVSTLTVVMLHPAAAESCPNSDCSAVVLLTPACGARLSGTAGLGASVVQDPARDRDEISDVEWWLYHPSFAEQEPQNQGSRILLDAAHEPVSGTRIEGAWVGSWTVTWTMTTRDTAWHLGGERTYALPPDDGHYRIEVHALDEPWWQDIPEPGPAPGRSAPVPITLDFDGDNPHPPFEAPTVDPGPSTFTDIDGNVHREAIISMASAAVIEGFDDGTFRPRAPVTRGQMAALLARALDLDSDPCAEGCGDVVCPDGHVHAGAIRAVTDAGIATGFDDGTFRPEQQVSRQQMASFLARAFELGLDSTDHPFTDVPSGSAHEAAIAAIVRAGITEGRTATTYAPGDQVQRGQIASFLDRALG